MRKTIFALAAIAFAAPAFAQQPPVMGDLDKDKDGKLSMEELTGGMPDMTEDMMKQYDANHDGFLDEQEFNAMMLAHK